MQNNNKNQCFIVDVDDSNIRIDTVSYTHLIQNNTSRD